MGRNGNRRRCGMDGKMTQDKIIGIVIVAVVIGVILGVIAKAIIHTQEISAYLDTCEKTEYVVQHSGLRRVYRCPNE